MKQISFNIDKIEIIIQKNEPDGFHFDNRNRPASGFVYFEEGEGTFTDGDGNSYLISPGSMVLLWEEEDYHFEFLERCRYITSAISFNTYSLPMKALFPRVITCNIEQQTLLRQTEKHWQTQNWDSFMQCRLQLEGIYLDILRENGNLRTQQDALIAKALEYIHEHYKEKFSTEKLTQTLMISATGLRSRFRAAMGCSILAYREKLRIQSAASMLSSGIFSIKEIAAELGYCDVAHFSKSFKKALGYTPGSYGKDHKYLSRNPGEPQGDK